MSFEFAFRPYPLARGIMHAKYILAFAFISLLLDTLKLRTGLLDTVVARAVCISFAQLAIGAVLLFSLYLCHPDLWVPFLVVLARAGLDVLYPLCHTIFPVPPSKVILCFRGGAGIQWRQALSCASVSCSLRLPKEWGTHHWLLSVLIHGL